MEIDGLGVRRDGNRVEIVSPHFTYCVDISSGLRARYLRNALSGHRIDLGGEPELEIDLDTAQDRIGITGWRVKCSHDGRCDADREPGYMEGLARPEMHDEDWRGTVTVAPEGIHADPEVEDKFYWARTHVFIPSGAEGRPLSLHLGGLGLYDFSYMRVFVNGHEIGERRADGRWNEPGVFDLGEGSSARSHVRFGQDNVIAVQGTGYRVRTERMEDVDPRKTRHLPMKSQWPGQFEQFLVVGDPVSTPEFEVLNVREREEGDEMELTVELSSPDSTIGAEVKYRWNSSEPVLHRFSRIRNEGEDSVTVLNVRLGTYVTDVEISDGEQGFPVYLGGELFAALAHPSGWAIGQHGIVRLCQYPGREIEPGSSMDCMEAIIGFAPAGGARERFISHVRGRCRRVTRGHEGVYAIYEPFGARPVQEFNESEEFILDNLEKVKQGTKDTDCHFDYYLIDFWVDHSGDLERFDPERFPHGLRDILPRIERIGASPGLWIDSSYEGWTIGGNPVVNPTLTHDPVYGADRATLCRATDPTRTIYSVAFRRHIARNGVRLVKFDNLSAICYNPNHDHMPGIYSTEAIQSAVIGTLRDLDSECPEVFLMLYWGHRSPWWLLHADTLFEPGLGIEAASPCQFPAPFVRGSVTVGLDQAQRWCVDLPAIGKDSLGVWLSSWPWNSSIGKERWQEAFIMDMCRGSLLAQPWSDEDWLSPTERVEIADFIALLRENTGCFANSRFVIGDPWKGEPYGYCCPDGDRAFVSVNNCTWKDARISLKLNPAWGLNGSGPWDIYRWYPCRSRLKGPSGAFGKETSITVRPFQVILLEIVPTGERPSLDFDFPVKPVPDNFETRPRELELGLSKPRGGLDLDPPAAEKGEFNRREVRIRCSIPPGNDSEFVVVSALLSKGPISPMISNLGGNFNAVASIDGGDVDCCPVVHEMSYPSCWQAWRLKIVPSSEERQLEMLVVALLPEGVEMNWEGHIIPGPELQT